MNAPTTPRADPRSATAAVLVAAGDSTRMGPGRERKPFLELEGRTVLEHCAAAFDACPAVRALVIVAHAADLERVRALASARPAFRRLAAVVAGGRERADSVRLGVEAAGDGVRLVAIHDAARPLVESSTIERAVALAAAAGAALVAVRARDTIHRAPDGSAAVEALERGELWCAQTPQVFERRRLLELLGRAASEGLCPTDDAALWERYVGPVPLVEGASSNLKLTNPEDLVVAAALLRAREGRTVLGAGGAP